MLARQRRSGDRVPIWSAVVALLLVLAGVVLVSGSTAQESAVSAPAEPPSQLTQGTPAAADPQVAEPTRIRVPSVGIDAAVGPLFLDGDGVLPPPASYDETGWWHDGPEPGEAGPAVIAGHVDSVERPAVFFRLDEIEPGAHILVDRADGSTAVFVAQQIERHAKDDFPTAAVYGPTPDPRLRLVTCGGAFNNTTRHYEDNVIVFATRTAG